jgi:hypothetical protein
LNGTILVRNFFKISELVQKFKRKKNTHKQHMIKYANFLSFLM